MEFTNETKAVMRAKYPDFVDDLKGIDIDGIIISLLEKIEQNTRKV